MKTLMNKLKAWGGFVLLAAFLASCSGDNNSAGVPPHASGLTGNVSLDQVIQQTQCSTTTQQRQTFVFNASGSQVPYTNLNAFGANTISVGRTIMGDVVALREVGNGAAELILSMCIRAYAPAPTTIQWLQAGGFAKDPYLNCAGHPQLVSGQIQLLFGGVSFPEPTLYVLPFFSQYAQLPWSPPAACGVGY